MACDIFMLAGMRVTVTVTGSIIFPLLKFLIRDSSLKFKGTPAEYVEELLRVEPETRTSPGLSPHSK